MDCVQQESILKIVEIFVQGGFGNSNTLGFQVVEKFVDGKPGAGIPEKMPHQLSKDIYVGHVESINDIAKKNGVDITLKQEMSVRGGKPLSLGKTTGG